MRKVRFFALLLLIALLLTGCASGAKTAHTYHEGGTHAHVYGNRYDAVSPTCISEGTVVRYCKICHADVAEQVAIPTDVAVRAHAFSDTVIEPTESSEGYTERRCTLCNYIVVRAFVVPAKYALLLGEQTQTVAPAGASGLLVSDTATHTLSYFVGADAAVSPEVACHLAASLTLSDELSREGAPVTPDTPVSFGGGLFAARELLTAYIVNDNLTALRALAVAIAGSEDAFAALVAARLTRLGVGDAIKADPFSPTENKATLAATGILLARVLDEPLLFDLYGVEPKNDLRIVAGKRPALYLTSADGTLRAVAISEASGVRFSVVFGEALPSDYEDALYPTK